LPNVRKRLTHPIKFEHDANARSDWSECGHSQKMLFRALRHSFGDLFRPLPRATRARSMSRTPPKRLPIVSEPRQSVPCLSCGLCCTYVAVEIDPPSTLHNANEIIWQLYHANVSVYRDADDDWMVQFETRCKHLQTDNKCGIYEQRPLICREHESETCEVNADDEGRTFYDAADFLSYLETRSKRIYNALKKRYLPGPEHLGRAQVTGELLPFDQRFAALRKLGQAKPAKKRA
jgi:Fe-S-cluster containining protein